MKKFGLIGKNISYSFSPTLHNKIFDIYNISATYDLFDIESENNLTSILKKLKNKSISGINVTIPYKTSILAYLDELSEEVIEIGATNCIKYESGKLKGYNTDYFGLIKTFKKLGLNLKNKKVIILGTGGAAKASIKAVKDFGGIVTLVSRNYSNELILGSKVITYDDLKNESGYLIINATPIGTYPNIDESPVTKDIIQNFDFVIDLIYNPKETLFLKYANELNKSYINGLYMLVAQGIKAEEIWNNENFNYESIYEDITQLIYK